MERILQRLSRGHAEHVMGPDPYFHDDYGSPKLQWH